MAVDPTAVASLLRINGLSLSSPQNEIHDLLARAGYSEEEIQQALSFALGTPAVNPATPAVTAVPGAAPPASVPAVEVTPHPASQPSVSQHSTTQSADGVPLPPYAQVDTKPVSVPAQTLPVTNPTKKNGPLFLYMTVGVFLVALIAFALIWFGLK